jgi:hypothetical protein
MKRWRTSTKISMGTTLIVAAAATGPHKIPRSVKKDSTPTGMVRAASRGGLYAHRNSFQAKIRQKMP